MRIKELWGNPGLLDLSRQKAGRKQKGWDPGWSLANSSKREDHQLPNDKSKKKYGKWQKTFHVQGKNLGCTEKPHSYVVEKWNRAGSGRQGTRKPGLQALQKGSERKDVPSNNEQIFKKKGRERGIVTTRPTKLSEENSDQRKRDEGGNYGVRGRTWGPKSSSWRRMLKRCCTGLVKRIQV